MLYRILIPILVLAAIALIVFSIIITQKKREKLLEEESRLEAEQRWDGDCQFDNPETGAKCQRQEFHLENHYREVNGKFIRW